MNGKIAKLLSKAAARDTERYAEDFPGRGQAELARVHTRKHTMLKERWRDTPKRERSKLRWRIEALARSKVGLTPYQPSYEDVS